MGSRFVFPVAKCEMHSPGKTQSLPSQLSTAGIGLMNSSSRRQEAILLNVVVTVKLATLPWGASYPHSCKYSQLNSLVHQAGLVGNHFFGSSLVSCLEWTDVYLSGKVHTTLRPLVVKSTEEYLFWDEKEQELTNCNASWHCGRLLILRFCSLE